MLKSGICLILGNTNVGKSTLINKLVGFKATITSDKPDTTRAKLMAIYNDDITQIAYIDSPGINRRDDFLAERLNKISYQSIPGNDIIYYVVDNVYSKYNDLIIKELKKETTPIFLVINKIDSYRISKLDEIILSFKDKLDFKEFIPVSAKDGKNLDILINKTRNYLTFNDLLFSKDFKITISEKEQIEEIIREKIFYFTDSEIPYSAKVLIEHEEKNKDIKTLYVSIILEKDSQKKIILGNNAEILKKIKEYAKKDIKKNLNKSYNLDLFIKVKKNWRRKKQEIDNINLGEWWKQLFIK